MQQSKPRLSISSPAIKHGRNLKMKKQSYTVSAEVLQQVLDCLRARWFIITDDGDSDNDDEVIDATTALETEIEKQDA